jgi:cytochrome c peroxidase
MSHCLARARTGALRFPRAALWAGWLLAASQIAEVRADADDKSRGPHGALAVSDQLALIAPWLKDEVVVPPGTSPQFFAAITPPAQPGVAAPGAARGQVEAPGIAREPGHEARAVVALGRRLFFEPRLSKDGTVTCATCHDASRGFSDRRATSEGIGDQIGKRNAPTTLNALFFSTQFWDGRAQTLEDQARLPIVNPIEMGQPDEPTALAAIAGDASYQQDFQRAFGRAPNFDDLARAIAAFERTMVFLDAPFDRFARGDAGAISDDAKAGFALFNGKARCTACHQISSSNPIGTDNRFHNIGVSARHQNFEELAKQALTALEKDSSREVLDKLALQTDLAELGRFIVTRNRSEIGAFKTSQLRNVGVTAPYMHDGSLPTLWDVIDHYNRGGEANTYLDGGIEPLNLGEREISQLVAFLFSLTDVRLAEQNDAEQKRQAALAAKQRPFRDVPLATRELFLFESRAGGAAKGAK